MLNIQEIIAKKRDKNKLTEEEQWAKIKLVCDIAKEVWKS